MEVECGGGAATICKKDKLRADVLENNATMCVDGEENDAESSNVEEEFKVLGKSSRSLSFCERMRILSPHHCPVRDEMKDKMVCYIDLL